LDGDVHISSVIHRHGHLFCAALCVLAVLWPCAPALAAPTAYGEHFVRLKTVAGSAESPAGNSDTDPEGGDEAEYERQLVELEQRGGPYASALAEPLAALARLQRQQGDLMQSRRLYERALHLVRVNEGLYSERQVPILRQLFGSYRQTGDMQALDARYDYYFRLYGAGLPPYTELRLGATLEYLRWQREALLLELDAEPSGRLLALYNLNQKVLAAVAGEEGIPYPLYKQLVLSQLCNLYLVRHLYRPELQSINEVPQHLTAGAWEPQDTNEYRLELLQRGAVTSGRGLLDELIARTPPEDRVELALNYLELGDWNQWNDKRSDADVAYRRVLGLLAEAAEPAPWLDTPRELPANGVFELPPPTGNPPATVVQASFDVTAQGRARNIETRVDSEDDEGRAGRFRRELAGVRFRPAYRQGEPAAVQDMSRRYEILP
jgi:hypothetical protein